MSAQEPAGRAAPDGSIAPDGQAPEGAEGTSGSNTVSEPAPKAESRLGVIALLYGIAALLYEIAMFTNQDLDALGTMFVVLPAVILVGIVLCVLAGRKGRVSRGYAKVAGVLMIAPFAVIVFIVIVARLA